MKQRRWFLKWVTLCVLSIVAVGVSAQWPGESIEVRAREYSHAGFYKAGSEGRIVYNFNVGWRFFKGDVENAWQADFDDSSWELLNVPHGLELLPEEASGGINYQGVAWYRKQFRLTDEQAGKKIFIHFEAIMGKSKVWINGKLVKSHFGGFLPSIVDVTNYVEPGKDNSIAVMADNSDDPDYPPGKPQETMDFAYFGGIYRDVWLVETNPVYITNPNFADVVAGGGVFVHYENLSEKQVTVVVETHVLNESGQKQTVKLESIIRDESDKPVGKIQSSLTMKAGESRTVKQKIIVDNPELWHPDHPNLYQLDSRVLGRSSGEVDAVRTRIGIRKIEFRGRDGLYINNKPFEDKLIGGNRHQDFAYVGSAISNNMHWRDVQKLREAGFRVIRSAHYPQDPAFMDACDELGMLVIVATPGWQFYNKKPIFSERVYSDIRNMIRRDRNHPSVMLWEPILNETHYPREFAQAVHDIVHEEFPYQGAYTAADLSPSHPETTEIFDVVFAHPRDEYEMEQSVFTREWGDNVDDWSSHNSTSRMPLSWGEAPQLIQANHYAKPDYPFSCIDRLYKTPRQHVGGTMWHSFDHQRGYHPDPFWGGIMDAFRQPKYAWYMFRSQRDPQLEISNIDNGPMVFIANELSPFSSEDITVYTNCDEVRLTVFGKEVGTQKARNDEPGIKHPIVVFEDAFDFMEEKKLHRARKFDQATVVAEGIVDGKVVTTSTRMPARRKTRIVLKADHAGAPLQADGSDLLTVVAFVEDDRGNVKRLCEDEIYFEVSGEGSLIGDAAIGSNPRQVEWGTAPALIRSTTTPGKISIVAKPAFGGINRLEKGELVIESIPANMSFIYNEQPAAKVGQSTRTNSNDVEPAEVEELKQKLEETQRELNQWKLKEIERQQEEFEGLN
ncbi:glycoside hydrolase family 2 TIM barrel-domain containing protein [Sunxiuqinia sp. sy24]|uniref:glycoside hydrolase family 2 TIM barrel-domain containing protein n=1 Tax=Sunxiuqinia sp. sy24 TaxID=3461495 RepID=UPI004045A876